ncbi:MAG: hypothetical protein PWP24_276 [Clostridiales bacterium]|nr:hypothetical protein [Clostridiales bacterium]
MTDGPFILPLHDKTIAMIWSSYSKKGYAVGVSYSKTGIYGPWEHQREPLCDKDGGHGMLFRDKRNHLLLAIHSPNEWMQERLTLIEIEEALQYVNGVKNIHILC